MAVPGKTTATVSWRDLADATVLMYRVEAIPQSWSPGADPSVQLRPAWTSVRAAHTCTTITATIKGLTSNTAYEFWLSAVHTTTVAYGNTAVPPGTLIGRSDAIVVR